jgi:hypothetical protein
MPVYLLAVNRAETRDIHIAGDRQPCFGFVADGTVANCINAPGNREGV